MPRGGYIARLQRGGMTKVSRATILGWYELIGAARGLSDHVLDLATNFLYRAVSERSVTVDEFRQVAVAALYVASKLEGKTAFKAVDVPVLTRDKMTPADLETAEADLLLTL